MRDTKQVGSSSDSLTCV